MGAGASDGSEAWGCEISEGGFGGGVSILTTSSKILNCSQIVSIKEIQLPLQTPSNMHDPDTSWKISPQGPKRAVVPLAKLPSLVVRLELESRKTAPSIKLSLSMKQDEDIDRSELFEELIGPT